MHYLFECFAKFLIEDRIDDWVNETVHVAQPRGEYEGGHAWSPVYIHDRTDRIRHITGEEW